MRALQPGELQELRGGAGHARACGRGDGRADLVRGDERQLGHRDRQSSTQECLGDSHDRPSEPAGLPAQNRTHDLQDEQSHDGGQCHRCYHGQVLPEPRCVQVDSAAGVED